MSVHTRPDILCTCGFLLDFQDLVTYQNVNLNNVANGWRDSVHYFEDCVVHIHEKLYLQMSQRF